MNYELDGLPLHILLVHAVVVTLPVASMCTAATMLWPAARRRLGLATPLPGLLGPALVFVTRQSGEWLLLRVAPTPAVLALANDARTLLPWAWALFGASLAAGIRHRYLPRRRMAVRLGSGWGLAGACLLPTGPPAIASLGTGSGPDSKKARKISCDLPGPHGARRGLDPPTPALSAMSKKPRFRRFCCLLFQ